jgi:hypothetical protein
MNETFHQPIDAAEVPRFAGHATFMRLPVAKPPKVWISRWSEFRGTAARRTGQGAGMGHERCAASPA